MPERLRRDFYTRPTLVVAKDLLGKYIVRKFRKRKIIGKIVEVEAYIGPKDKASHAYLGKITKRNRAEFLIGGHIYIYLVYGMYWQLNISTYLENKPECVLIRALEPIEPKIFQGNKKIANGPGKLCKFLKLNKSFYGEDLVKSKRIWLEDWKDCIKKEEIVATSRIGIDYAGPYWSKIPWRFYLKNSPFISRK